MPKSSVLDSHRENAFCNSDAHQLDSSRQPILFGRYRDAILQLGTSAKQHPETLVAVTERHSVFYVPFEHVNVRARLVIVGITPGPNQIALAYATVRRLTDTGAPDNIVLAEAKREAAFGGPTMRPNLVRMLDAFGFAQILKITDVGDLWGDASQLLHATSVIPHAAFDGDKPFAGSFEDIMASPALQATFEGHFVPSLAALPTDARFVALGRTPLAALDWCAARGHLRQDQVLGAFAHPSTNGGSQVGVYLGTKKLSDLSEGDPVRSRVAWLREAAARMNAATRAIGGGMINEEPGGPVRAPKTLGHGARRPVSQERTGIEDAEAGEAARNCAFEVAGFRLTGQTLKVALFERASACQSVYLVRQTEKLKVVVHPALGPKADIAADEAGGVFEGFYHNSNMRQFPSRTNDGKTAVRYGLGYTFSTTASLTHFLKLIAG
ncbi:hypothetical protein [Methylorubrum extorquens]